MVKRDKVSLKLEISKCTHDLLLKYAELRGLHLETMLTGGAVRQMERDFRGCLGWEEKLLAGKLKLGSRNEILGLYD